MAEISPFRRRMIEHMTVRDLSPATQQSYLNAISKFSRYFGRFPDRLNLVAVHAFQGTLRQTTGPLTIGLAYTFSHSLDDASDNWGKPWLGAKT